MLPVFFKQKFFPLRYPLVGGITFLIESSLYSALLGFTDQTYNVSYAGAGIVAFLFNFPGHWFFTFKDQRVRPFSQQLFLEGTLKGCLLVVKYYAVVELVKNHGYSPYVGVVVSASAMIVTFLGTSLIFGGSKPLETLNLLGELLRALWRRVCKLWTRLCS